VFVVVEVLSVVSSPSAAVETVETPAGHAFQCFQWAFSATFATVSIAIGAVAILTKSKR
jgi:hypothetical protein